MNYSKNAFDCAGITAIAISAFVISTAKPTSPNHNDSSFEAFPIKRLYICALIKFTCTYSYSYLYELEPFKFHGTKTKPKILNFKQQIKS